MDLTWIAAGSVPLLVLLGTGYVVVRRPGRFRVVCWSVLCAALFAMATRDLFRPREGRVGRARERHAGQARGRTTDRTSARKRERASARRSDRSAGETASPLVARLRRRFARWLD